MGYYVIILVDLDKTSLFRYSSSFSLAMKRRRLVSSNSAAVESYLRYSNEKLKDNRIIQKLSKLIDDWPVLPSVDRDTIMNKIDDQLYQIFTKAEKQCRKLRTGEVDYSPELSDLGLKWHFW